MSLAPAPQGIQRIAPGANHARHRHAAPYAALVLRGAYEEAGSGGRWRLTEGDVLFHAAFDAHCDRFAARDAQILNLPLPPGWSGSLAAAHCRNVSAVLRRAGRDPRAAAQCLLHEIEPAAPLAEDWPDLLVADLRTNPSLQLSHWAARHGLSRETLSRGLARVYGVAPARLRRELRALAAHRLIASGTGSLACIAAQTGFADQAHMSREVKALTGRAPGALRPLSSRDLPAAAAR